MSKGILTSILLGMMIMSLSLYPTPLFAPTGEADDASSSYLRLYAR